MTRQYLAARSFILMAVLGLLALASGRSIAQNANEILEASKQAINEVDGLSAQFKMEGIGGGMFADTMPSLSGKAFYGSHSEYGRVVRVLGESKDKSTDPSKPLDLMVAQDRYLWVDRDAKQIIEAPRNGNTRNTPSISPFVFIDSFTESDPFAKDANGAESITLGAQEPIDGVLCDQVVIKRGKPPAGRRPTGQHYTDVIWWISTTDKLPRKVHKINNADFIKITFNFELSNMQIEENEDAELEVRRPDGFTFVSRMPKAAPEPDETDAQLPGVEGTPADTQITEERPAQPATPSTAERVKRAPSYAFNLVDGSEVSNETQNGRVTLLYFWGSWCMPCTETSPMVNDLAEDLGAESLDVYALAIREGNPNEASTTFSRAYPNPKVSVNPRGLISTFNVRVFPTVVVIDQSGAITFQQSIGRGFTAAQLMDDAKTAAEKAIGAG